MITAIIIFFASVIGILILTLIVFSYLRNRQKNQNSGHHFTGLGLTDSSSSYSDGWDYNSADSSDTWSTCSSSDSGGSSCGSSCGGCGGGGD